MKYTEEEQTRCWMFDDELWTRFLNVTFIQLWIFWGFFDRKSVQYVSKHRNFTMAWYVKRISAKNVASKRDICLFGDNSLAARDPVPACALVCATLLGGQGHRKYEKHILVDKSRTKHAVFLVILT